MKNSQRGGIASFVIVALVLTGLLVGGLYLSKHQARVARNTDTSSPQVATQDQKQAQTKNDDTKKDTDTAPTDQKPATTAPSTQPATTPTPVTTPAPTATVPDTGPTEVVAVGFALSALTYATVMFLQTRIRSQRSSPRS